MLPRILDWSFIFILLVSIVLALVLDFQPFYPDFIRDSFLKYIVEAFCEHYKSTLLCLPPPVWLKTFLFIELLFLFPMYIIGTYGIFMRRNWVRDPMIIIGFYYPTSTLVYMVETYYNDTSPLKMELIYGCMPFNIIFILMLLRFYTSPHPYPDTKSKTE